MFLNLHRQMPTRWPLRARWIISGLICAVLPGLVAAKTVTVQVGVGGSSGGGYGGGGGASFVFKPANITINVGDTVQWTWMTNDHSTTSGSCASGNCVPDGNWDSGVHKAPNSYTHLFTKAGTYSYFCLIHGTQGMVASVTVVQPHYSVSIPSVTAGPVFPGQTAIFNGVLSTQDGFSSPVNLSCAPGAPSVCTPVPASPTPSSAGTPFTVTAGGMAAGSFQFTLQAVGTDFAQTSHTSPVLTLAVVDFALGPLGSVTSLASGTSPPQQFMVTGSGGFTGAVNLGCAGLPAGASCGFSPNPVNLSGASPSAAVALKVFTAQTLAGIYPVTINASTGSIPNAPVHSGGLNLTVQDYQVSIANPVPLVFPGDAGSFSGTITPLEGYSGTVGINCGPFDTANTPSVTCTTPAPIAVSGPNPVGFSVGFTTNANSQVTSPKDYTSLIGATDANSIAHTQSSTVRVVDFALTAPNPATVNIAKGNPSAPIALTVSAFGEWEPSVALSCSAPTGATCIFSPAATVIPVSGSAQSLTLVVDSGSAAVSSNNTVTITASVPALVTAPGRARQLTLNITAGSGSTDLAVATAHTITAPAKADPAPVGATVEFTATVSNNSGSPANPMVLLTFSDPVAIVSAPGCTIGSGSVSCAVAGTFPQSFGVTVVAPFTRTLSATAFVSSDSSDTNPANNSGIETVQVRPRPLARNGLPPTKP